MILPSKSLGSAQFYSLGKCSTYLCPSPDGSSRRGEQIPGGWVGEGRPGKARRLADLIARREGSYRFSVNSALKAVQAPERCVAPQLLRTRSSPPRASVTSCQEPGGPRQQTCTLSVSHSPVPAPGGGRQPHHPHLCLRHMEVLRVWSPSIFPSVLPSCLSV